MEKLVEISAVKERTNESRRERWKGYGHVCEFAEVDNDLTFASFQENLKQVDKYVHNCNVRDL